MQSTFLNAFRGIKRGVVPELESAWLFKIAENVCLSRRRSTWRRDRIESPADFDIVEELTPAPSRHADELIGLQDVLEQMPENQRRAILLREWQGLSYREIADELELSQAAVETLIFRARRSLAQGLEAPTEQKRRRIRGADLANVLSGLKSLLLSGGAAVKVAAAVAVVSATTVVSTAPVVHHHARASKTSTVSSQASSPTSSGSVAGSPAPVVLAPSSPKPHVNASVAGSTGVLPTIVQDTTSAPPASPTPAVDPTPAQAPPSDQPSSSSAPQQAPAAPAPAVVPPGQVSKQDGGTGSSSAQSNGDGNSSNAPGRGKKQDGGSAVSSTVTTVVPTVAPGSSGNASGRTKNQNDGSSGGDSSGNNGNSSSAQGHGDGSGNSSNAPGQVKKQDDTPTTPAPPIVQPPTTVALPAPNPGLNSQIIVSSGATPASVQQSSDDNRANGNGNGSQGNAGNSSDSGSNGRNGNGNGNSNGNSGGRGKGH